MSADLPAGVSGLVSAAMALGPAVGVAAPEDWAALELELGSAGGGGRDPPRCSSAMTRSDSCAAVTRAALRSASLRAALRREDSHCVPIFSAPKPQFLLRILAFSLLTYLASASSRSVRKARSACLAQPEESLPSNVSNSVGVRRRGRPSAPGQLPVHTRDRICNQNSWELDAKAGARNVAVSEAG